MATSAYYQRLLSLTRQYLSPYIYGEMQKHARGFAGGTAGPRSEDHVANLIDAARITPERLSEDTDENLGLMHASMHTLTRSAQMAHRNDAPYRNALSLLYSELSKRGVACSECVKNVKRLEKRAPA